MKEEENYVNRQAERLEERKRSGDAEDQNTAHSLMPQLMDMQQEIEEFDRDIVALLNDHHHVNQRF